VNGNTPFSLLVREHPALLDSFLGNETNRIYEKTVIQEDSLGNSMLIASVLLRCPDNMVLRILDRDHNIGKQNKLGNTALHIAVATNQRDTGLLLVNYGANIYTRNNKTTKPFDLIFFSLLADGSRGSLWTAAEGGRRDWMLAEIVLRKTDDNYLGYTAMHYIVELQLNDEIAALAARGADINAVNAAGDTPLFLAMRTDKAVSVQRLLAAGARPDVRDNMGNTALHIAVNSTSEDRPGSRDAAAAFIAATARNTLVNDYNQAGFTPLHEAIRQNKQPMEELLLRSGANLEIRNNDGDTPLFYAVDIGRYASAKRLLDARADIMARNNIGDTPLMRAVMDERSDLVALLLDANAQIYAKNSAGESPFTHAMRYSPRMMYTLLSMARSQTYDDEGNAPLAIAIKAGITDVGILGNIVDIVTSTVRTADDADTKLKRKNAVNIVDRNGKNPLRLVVDLMLGTSAQIPPRPVGAPGSDNWEAASYLAALGSSPFVKAHDNLSAADVLLLNDNSETAKGLSMIFAVNKNITDNLGNTILHLAAAKPNNRNNLNALIGLGVSLVARNTAGETAYDIAMRWDDRNEYAYRLDPNAR
jgi:ankyrin repeat protein